MKAKIVLHHIKDDTNENKHSNTIHDFKKDEIERKEKDLASRPELSHQEKEDAIIEAVKKAPKIGFNKLFDEVKDVHQSTLPKKKMLKDVLGSIKDGINDKEHSIEDENKDDAVLKH